MWDHGGGLLGSNEDLKFDDIITPADLAQALQTAERTDKMYVDLVAFDACLMQMAEVATAVAGETSVVVGSEESEAGSGFDYATALTALESDPQDVTPDELATNIVQSYEVSTAGLGQDDTLSAIETNQLVMLNARRANVRDRRGR